MTPEQLDEIEARANTATEGPWEQNGYVVNASHGIGDVIADAGLAPADARFIANARADVPALVAEVRRLTTQRDGLRDGIDTIAGLINRQLSDEASGGESKCGWVYAHDLIAVLESIPAAGHSKDNESEDR